MSYVVTAIISLALGYAARSDRGKQFIAAIFARLKR